MGDDQILLNLSNGAWARKYRWSSNKALSTWKRVTAENGRVTKLIVLDEKLTGSIPPELGQLQNLRELNLWSSKLTEEIPKELGRLENLQRLDLRWNMLIGSIPAELGQLQNLQKLQLWGNKLTGIIPKELGHLEKLEYLNLSENQLTGTIPPQLGSLRNLRVLVLRSNQLTGSIPKELGQLANLTLLWLHGNQLSDSPGDLSFRFTVARWQRTLAKHGQDAERQRSEEAAEALRRQEAEQAAAAERRRVEANAAAAEAAERQWQEQEAERRSVEEANAIAAAERRRQEQEAQRLKAAAEAAERQRQNEEARLRAMNSIEPWLRDAGFAPDDATAFAKRFKGEHVATALAVQRLSREKVLGLARNFGMHENLVNLLTASLDKAVAAEREEAARAAAAEEHSLAAEAERQRIAEEKSAAAEAKRRRVALVERNRELESSDVARWLRGVDMPTDAVLPLVELFITNSCNTLGVLKVQDEQDMNEILIAGDVKKPIIKAFLHHWRVLCDGAADTPLPSVTSSLGQYVRSAPTSLGKYVDRVACESFGQQSAISFARDPTRDVRVVIKEYPVENLCAYDREYEILKYLQKAARDCVIPLEDVFAGPLHRYLVVRRGGDDLRALIKEKRRYLQSLSEPERLNNLQDYATDAAVVLEAIHTAGIVWGDVKPENFVQFNHHLVAIDFEASARIDDSPAGGLFGVTNKFSPVPAAMQNFSTAYCSPERALCVRAAKDCPAEPEQDVWSLGMLLFWLVTGRDYFKGVDAPFIESQLCRSDFSVDLRSVPAGPWRKAVELALKVEPLARGTAGDVRRMLTKESHSVLTKSRVAQLFERMDRMEGGQRELLELGRGAAGTLAEMVQGELACPKLFFLLEERSKGYLPRPSKWFNKHARLVFVCAHEPHLVECGPDKKGFFVQQPKEWARKYGPVLQTTLLVVALALKAGVVVATSGAASLIPLPDLEIIQEAYAFLGDPDVVTAVEDTLDALESEEIPERAAEKAGTAVRDVTGDSYRSLIAYLAREHAGWDAHLGGLKARRTRGGAVAWVCEEHARAWESSDREPRFRAIDIETTQSPTVLKVEPAASEPAQTKRGWCHCRCS